MPTSRMQRQTTRLSDRQLSFLDKLTEYLGYRSRSETIRWLVCLARLIWLNIGTEYLIFLMKSTLDYMLFHPHPAMDPAELERRLADLESQVVADRPEPIDEIELGKRLQQLEERVAT